MPLGSVSRSNRPCRHQVKPSGRHWLLIFDCVSIPSTPGPKGNISFRGAGVGIIAFSVNFCSTVSAALSVEGKSAWITSLPANWIFCGIGVCCAYQDGVSYNGWGWDNAIYRKMRGLKRHWWEGTMARRWWRAGGEYRGASVITPLPVVRTVSGIS
jgi:hypothetical protein